MVVIALSGMPGAGSSTIARMLAKKLKLDYFSPGKYYKSLAKKDHEAGRALSLWRTKKGSEKGLHEKIDKMQVERAKKGNVVICGKLSIYFLRDIADVKIWLECSLDERARRTAGRDKISFEEAKREISERGRIASKEWRRMYGIDREDQKKMANVVVDSSGFDKDETLRRIFDKISEFFTLSEL